MRLALLSWLILSGIVIADEKPSELAVRKPMPDRLVVLTFDDSSKSHFTVARPLLKEYGFGATFFITEGFDFKENKRDYMTWDEIRQLHEDGFEIGNHTRDHLGITDKTVDRLDEQLEGIESQCKSHGIPSPTTFAWPGNATSPAAFAVLQKHGIQFARRGGHLSIPMKKGEDLRLSPAVIIHYCCHPLATLDRNGRFRI